MKLNSKHQFDQFFAREMKRGAYHKLLRGFAVNIGNLLQNNKSIKSFNIFQNYKICSINDYTFFL